MKKSEGMVKGRKEYRAFPTFDSKLFMIPPCLVN